MTAAEAQEVADAMWDAWVVAGDRWRRRGKPSRPDPDWQAMEDAWQAYWQARRAFVTIDEAEDMEASYAEAYANNDEEK